jgi:hypothetical protein
MKSWTIVAMTLCAILAAHAGGQTVQPRTVDFQIHADPLDLDSDVLYTITMHLEPHLVQPNGAGGRVEWDIIKIDLTQTAPDMAEVKWSELDPFVHTANGRWQTVHDDLAAPRDVEFSQPPPIDGFAKPDDHDGGDLAYEFQSGSPAAPLYDADGYIDFALWQAGEDEPEAEGDDEPVDVDSTDDPS